MVNLYICYLCNKNNTPSLHVYSLSSIYTGYLEAPTNLQLTEMNSETIQLSWGPPFTLAGVPILQYSVYVDDFTRTPERISIIENTTSVQYVIQKPCSSIRFSVSGWNELGEGAHSASVEYTSSKTYQCLIKVLIPCILNIIVL